MHIRHSHDSDSGLCWQGEEEVLSVAADLALSPEAELQELRDEVCPKPILLYPHGFTLIYDLKS